MAIPSPIDRKRFPLLYAQMALAIATYFPPDTRITVPKGGLVLWVKLNRHVDSLKFYREAQRRRLSILPGVICSTTTNFKHFIRTSCGYPWTPEIERAQRCWGRLPASSAMELLLNMMSKQ